MADSMDWVEFWGWANTQGLRNRADLDRAVGRLTNGMTPQQIHDAIVAPPLPSGSMPRRAPLVPAQHPRSTLPVPSVPSPSAAVVSPKRVTLRQPCATQEEWVAFWRWAQSQGHGNRAALDKAAGVSTAELPPGEVRRAIEWRKAISGPGPRPGMVIPPPRPPSTFSVPSVASPRARVVPSQAEARPTRRRKRTSAGGDDGSWVVGAVIIGLIVWWLSTSSGGNFARSYSGDDYSPPPSYDYDYSAPSYNYNIGSGRGGCGSRGGPGYRLSNGKCASWDDDYNRKYGSPRYRP